MSNDPAHIIAEAVAEVQVALYKHYRRGKGTSPQVLAKINFVLSERTPIRAAAARLRGRRGGAMRLNGSTARVTSPGRFSFNGGKISNDPVHAIADAVAEAQTALYNHYQYGRGTSAQVLAKINVILSERTLVRAMYDMGYIPASRPPDVIYTLPAGLE